jgi:hypothetical protein
MALLPYIGLNVIHCFPETWDLASGKTDEKDYRRMRIYQYMLKHCTLSGTTSEVATHPHRQFFGIEDGQFHVKPKLRDPRLNFIGRYPYGLVPFEEFLNCETQTENKPRLSDILQVQEILRNQGLPIELVINIMAEAEYAPRGRLRVPHDPFHPENRDELDKYLKYCWQLLVRCDMMGCALGREIPWQELICSAMVQLFSCGSRRWHKWDASSPLNDYVFI